ncbi:MULTISPECIES: AAA family ATPase [Bacillales]|uniref:AAA family ATPase n=1 Tax=Bacillales TaxID=1385 RepID=UPI000349B76D|nr:MULTISPECIES: AAA family ATPase [Bacillales]KMZ42917.1 hypothetical protein AC624_18305 [Bacillus sp. FJAT-27238]
MKLKKVDINNFRSINNITINFDPTCRILVGKNESGKSNILKALALLNNDYLITNSDLREGLPEEALIEKGFIRFVFSFESSERRVMLKDQLSKTLTSSSNKPILMQGKMKISIEDYYLMDHDGLFKVEFPKELRYEQNWVINGKYDVLQNWKKPKSSSNYLVSIDGIEKSIASYELIDIEDYPSIPISELEDVTPKCLHDYLGKRIRQFVNENKPETVFWSYDDTHLLPSVIDLDNFTSNPNGCVPLKSMFNLAGINDINKAIRDAQQKSNHGLRNLLERVASLTTEHFRKVWKEYKYVQFELNPNGSNIEATIKDSFNRYAMSQRSDGFKRFVSFLLLISAKVESETMKNAIILFDEPDLGLHPSGSRFLREEIIKISKNNVVIYSTHSIFMIDKENISRHLLVSKSNEITKIEEVNESNMIDEEVIYNALGYTVFESLKTKNIIFEGWKDKKLLQIALTKVPKKYSDLKKLKEFGYCHARGVKDVKNIANILELAGREYFIISDSDNPAKEKQKEFQELRLSGTWKRYDELLSEYSINTSEDFLKIRSILKCLNEINKVYDGFPQFVENDFKSMKSRLLVIEEKLREYEPNKENRKKIIEEIKNELFENVTQADIEEYYYEMLIHVTGHFYS